MMALIRQKHVAPALEERHELGVVEQGNAWGVAMKNVFVIT
jgi:hypothetical protein